MESQMIKTKNNQIITALLARGIMHSMNQSTAHNHRRCVPSVHYFVHTQHFRSNSGVSHSIGGTSGGSSCVCGLLPFGLESGSLGGLRTCVFLGEDLCGLLGCSRSQGSGGLTALGRAGGRKLAGLRASGASKSLVPFGRILGSVCLESILVGHGKLVAKAAATGVLSFNHELLSIESADHAVRKVERSLGNGILCKIVVGFELVHEVGTSDDPEASLVLLK